MEPRYEVHEAILPKGLIFGLTGCVMSPTHTRKGGRIYRYYVSQAVLKQGRNACPVWAATAGGDRGCGDRPGARSAARRKLSSVRSSKAKVGGLSEDQVRRALQDRHPPWDKLFAAEQARIVQLLVERVDVGDHGFDLRLRVDGLAHLARDLSGSDTLERKAA